MAAVFAATFVVAGASAARAQEDMVFPSQEDAKQMILSKIWAETERIDIATWYLTQREISAALVSRHNAGVKVRVIGDRVSIFEIDATTRREFEYLASNGVPVRLRYFPTTFPSIMHWKSGIFVGQGVWEFGSANWTPFELRPVSATDYKDETVMFTDDPGLVSAAKSRFDQFWADTSKFLDWPQAYQRETGQPWPLPMTIDRTRLEPNVAGPSTMVWEQGSVLNNRMASEINAETNGVDIVIYRLSNAAITNALLNRINAGVPVRVMIEPGQYREDQWPEYWMTGTRVDQLWVAGAQIKERAHTGITHMKVLITSRYGMHGSSNFTNNWQRDHNYFIPSSTKPVQYNELRDEFDRMWADTTNYRDFRPRVPRAPVLSSPADGATGLSTTPRLVWNRAPWAVAFDVWMGTTSSNLVFQGRVNAELDETPPATYSFTPGGLQPGTRYYWRVVSRTFATDVDPSIVAVSSIQSFVTAGSGGGGTSTPFGGTPVSLPGTVQAENFDEGGEAVAYHDTTGGNAGGAYRATDVDIASSGDVSGAYTIGWFPQGEWLKYTVNVTAAGTYDLEFRIASAGGGGTFHLESNGVNKTGPIAIPDTGGWAKWATVRKTGVSLSAGQQVFRVVADTAGPGGAVMNLNYFSVKAADGEPPPPTASEIVIYAADVPAGNIHGNWAKVGDGTAAAGVQIASANLGAAAVNAPAASPANYYDVTFQAQAGVRYRLWLRVNADGDSKWNDSLYVQFSGSVNASGTPIYRIGTTQGLNVNQATCSTCTPAGWGWHNGAYWLSDTGDVWFSSTGTQTMRIQIREDGVQVDQMILSPAQYSTTPPGPAINDNTIVPKP